MARIAGVDIPREKRVEIALTYIYGIGLPTAQKILVQTNVNSDTRVRDLTEEQVNRLRELIDRRFKVEGVHAAIDTGVMDFLFVCDQDDPSAASPLLSASMPVDGRLEHPAG